MQLARRYRIPALFCALAVLVCELISRPYANMGICDDGPYILVAQRLADTGHIVYNGWSAAMLGWQLYLGAALVKLFGFSFTTVRMSTLLVAVVLAFFLQRILVRAGITERNATIGTLALVLSPLYLLLSATFMSDIHGLFAIVLCLYGCLRALQASSTRATIGWLCFAVATNAVCGTSRQLAWLGVLVMVPCTLWLLRDRRKVLVAGAAATLAGVLFILGCMVWLKHQPYTTPERFHVSNVPLTDIATQFVRFFLDFPFLLLPVMLLFVAAIRRSRIGTLAAILVACLVCAFGRHRIYLLEPTIGDWVTIAGGYHSGGGPIFLGLRMRILLTIASFCGLTCLIISFFRQGHSQRAADVVARVSWKQLFVVLAPFAAAYVLLLVFRAVTVANDGTGVIFDRYSLGLLLVALIFLVRYFQDRIQPLIPFAGLLLVAAMATYGVAITHNMFSFNRARVAIAAELRAAGVPDTSTDNGWEYNIEVQIQHTGHVNSPFIVLPAGAYVPTRKPPAVRCEVFWYDFTPIIHPIYGIAFYPDVCYGPAPFAPVHYSRWFAGSPGTLYVVNYLDPSKR